jgi:potassium/hydrogen antiporter
MEGSIVVIFIGVLVLLSHGFVAISSRTRIPDVLFLIAIGVLVGPLLHLVSSRDFGQVGQIFTMLVLVLILFEGGIELRLRDLISSFRDILILTIVSYVLSAILILLIIVWLADFSFVECLFLAAVLAGPAPSVVIPLVRNTDMDRFSHTTLTTEAALGETLSILVALAILDWMRLQDVHYGKMVGALLSSFALAVIIGIGGGYLWSLFLTKVRQLKNAMFMTPAVVFIVYGICELIGYSGPVAALAFGITIENVSLIRLPSFSKKIQLSPIHINEQEKLFLGEIVFLAKTFFFVYLGLSLELSTQSSLRLAVLLTMALLMVRIISVRFSIRPRLISSFDAGIIASMIPKGLAAAVLATLYTELAPDSGEAVRNLIYGTIIVSIVISSIFVSLMHKPVSRKVSGFLFRGFGIAGKFNADDQKKLSK